ncbi:hypothetical protein Q1695_008758 [Nippostrongylus brasiliensis]|nr:hypothetical protein Q1695_008758 [Nippostrongylus brasiliensis]
MADGRAEALSYLDGCGVGGAEERAPLHLQRVIDSGSSSHSHSSALEIVMRAVAGLGCGDGQPAGAFVHVRNILATRHGE